VKILARENNQTFFDEASLTVLFISFSSGACTIKLLSHYGFHFQTLQPLSKMNGQGWWSSNGTAHIKNVNNGLITNIYSYLEISSGQSYNQYLDVVHFFNTSLI
jgi:hypothetical protein